MLYLLSRLVRRPAARVGGSDRVDRRIALFDVGDFALGVDHKRRAVRHPGLLNQHTIRGRDFPFSKIAQERNGDIVLLSELSLRGDVVGADAEDLCPRRVKFGDTSLVRLKFLGSTTGKRRWEERQHDGVFAFEVGKLDPAALGGRQVNLGRSVTYV